MSQTPQNPATPVEESETHDGQGSAPEPATLPADHPLASVIGIFKGDPIADLAWQEVEAYRRRVNEEELARLEGQPTK